MVMERTAPGARAVGPDIRIGPMRRRHLRSVVRLEEKTNPRPWSMALFLSELRYSESRAYVVAHAGTRLVGYAGMMIVVGDAHVTNVAVDESVRRAGIATRMMLVLARRAIAEDAEALTLEVRASNTGAQALYRRFGFAPAGVRKNYYAESNEDAVIMWANDIATPAYRDRLRQLEDALVSPTRLDPVYEPDRRPIDPADPADPIDPAAPTNSEDAP